MEPFYLQGHVVTETHVLENHCLVVQNGAIQSMAPNPPVGTRRFELEPQDDLLILPAFRDPHTHDVNGQLAVPNQSEAEIMARLSLVMKAYARRGVSAVYLSTFGADMDDLLRYCECAKRYMDDPKNGVEGTRLAGFNIEGSFLNRECRGAQPAEYCITPETHDCIEAIDRLAATGAVRMINIAPDYGEGSLNAIRHARALGILVGSGHLKPPADLLRRAFDECGLQYMVHFTNGPTGQSFKPFGGGGAFEGAMDLPIAKELILDLAHIDRRYVLDMIRRNEERWGPDHIIAITDASFPIEAELPKGEFHIGSTVAMKDHAHHCLRAVAYVEPDGTQTAAPPNTLCGSILSMDQAFSNLISIFTQSIEGIWHFHPKRPLEQALADAARLCAANQAKLDGAYPATGSLAPGKSADIVVGALRSNVFTPAQTFIAGNPAMHP